jgi:uncharacterized cupredoxin-like copper-binding protein
MRRFIAIAAVFAVAVGVLAGCSSSGSDHGDMGGTMSGDHMEESSPVVPGAREVPVTADALSFSPKRIEIAAKEDVTIVLTSNDLAHDFYVKGIGHITHAGAGKTSRGGLMIEEPGTYQFWCTVKGHKEGGMTGTITVT